MGKILPISIFSLLCLFTSQVFAAGQTPEQVTKAFYSRYMALEHKGMFMKKPEALKYMTAEIEKKIARPKPPNPANTQGTDLPDDDPGHDYFTKTNDFGDDWDTAITASTVFQKNKVAIVKVALGKEQDMQIKLAVVLIQASGGWKISKIFYLAESPNFYE